MWSEVEYSGVRWRVEGVEVESFLGDYTLKLDDKGRMLLPAKYRPAFADGICIARSPDGCLRGYRMPDYLDQLAKLQEAGGSSRAARRRVRMFASSATDQVPDSQGWVLVPQALREYATLEREIVVAGCGKYIEVWSADRWADELSEAEPEFSSMDDDEGGFF